MPDRIELRVLETRETCRVHFCSLFPKKKERFSAIVKFKFQIIIRVSLAKHVPALFLRTLQVV